ncbi:PQQ-like beta-propeller repeat protein [Akkermansiaceae bacterium]|nr:PQQ-like beta-propeller repeat protein [bacterium]MDB4332285.1 PQQ-like beta-propeller repeat protein [Akkermansiaceae bacterium]MDB4796152.1 PQQ-like beta-propeller repeat protein [Akkermansiaceae bacterium]MDC0275165.1 PQQ-like beta-propeller repeat protein [Akkermansiaceae bacterium]
MKNDTYLGIKGHVVCIDTVTGQEVWRRHLKSGYLTTLSVGEERIIAHPKGDLFGLRRATGEILWRNPLTGLGYGNCIIASNDPNTDVVLAAQQQAQQGAAAAGTAGVVAAGS